HLYRSTPALHELDGEPAGFDWIEANDAENSVFSFLRSGIGEAAPVVVIANMTPVVRHGFRIGVPSSGTWAEVLNSDLAAYGGSDVGNRSAMADPVAFHGRAHSIELDLPPLATIMLQPASPDRPAGGPG